MRKISIHCFGLFAIFCALLTRPVLAVEEVWSIGKPDGKRNDFALSERGNYDQFPKHFGEVVEYKVGRSKPEKDFPFIHPGPMDRWAGSKPHVLKIHFDLSRSNSGADHF